MRHFAHILIILALAACTKVVDEDEDGFDESVDCDDTNAVINPLATEVCDDIDNNCDGNVDEDLVEAWYPDADADGWGDDDGMVETCDPGAEMVSVGGDCDDTNAAFHPEATEDDCTDPNDYNCDGSVGYADADADGYAACEDCDDSDDNRNPGLDEVCDDVDNDCSGYVDDDATDAETWYMDADLDGYGNPDFSDTTCDPPLNSVTNDLDCDDGDSDNNPGALETCDGEDNDCDGTVDEDDAIDAPTWYQDSDRDGYGDLAVADTSCEAPSNYVDNFGDCDDRDDDVNPDAEEVCDETDNDCDGTVDEDDASDASVWYLDTDGDDYGDPAVSTRACDEPLSYVSNALDCDPSDADIYPGSDEVCDSVDNDCDGNIDEYGAVDADTWYADSDSDGYGTASATLVQCDQPSGYVTNDDDCDDTDGDTSPDGTEVCDDEDNDCDGDIDDADSNLDTTTGTEFFADVDSDTWGDASSTVQACELPTGYVENDDDCDDTDSSVGYPDTWYSDDDGDGYGDPFNTLEACSRPSGYVTDSSDCDDTDPAITEGWTFYEDTDDDGYGDPDTERFFCSEPVGWVDNDDDCDDADDSVNPMAPDYCDGADSNCDGYHNEIDVPADYSTISSAISAASDGDSICVSAGTYAESISWSSKDLTLHGISGSSSTTLEPSSSTNSRVLYAYDFVGGIVGFTITGATATSSSYNGLGMYLQQFDGTLEDVVVTDIGSTYYYTYGLGLYLSRSDAILQDVWIYENWHEPGTHSSTYEQSYGLGMYVDRSDVVIRDTYIGDNWFTGTTTPDYAYTYGTGLYSSGTSNITMESSMVVNNATSMAASNYSYCYGNGIRISSFESFTGHNLWVSGNTCEADWGNGMGMYASGSYLGEIELDGAVFADNQGYGSGTGTNSSCYFYGGGAYFSDVILTVVNSSFTENYLEPTGNLSTCTPYAYGGGLYVYHYYTDSEIVNNDFSNNTLAASGSNYGGGVYESGYSSGTVFDFEYNNVYGNTSAELYGSVLSSSTIGTDGNIAADPAYTDTSSSDSSTWDLSLGTSSSLIDAGDPSILDSDGTTSDIGSHGGEYGSSW